VPTLRIKVKPGARKAALVHQPDGSWLASVEAPPVDGKANVTIRSGASGRLKTVDIEA